MPKVNEWTVITDDGFFGHSQVPLGDLQLYQREKARNLPSDTRTLRATHRQDGQQGHCSILHFRNTSSTMRIT